MIGHSREMSIFYCAFYAAHSSQDFIYADSNSRAFVDGARSQRYEAHHRERNTLRGRETFLARTGACYFVRPPQDLDTR